MKEINIKSSTIEKGLELAKEFVGKLIGPTVEELGLLLSDNIKYLRYKNQIRILLKARNYVEKRNINTKEIPIKILVPLLEKASLEEDEKLQDKWAKMIANLVDSESTLENQIFPYLLSQISIEEFEGLKQLEEKEKEYWKEYRKLREIEKEKKGEYVSPYGELGKLKSKLEKIEQQGYWVSLESYEYSNLERLGLVRELPPNIIIEEFKTGSRYVEYGEYEEWHQIEAKYDPDDIGYRITELGQMFLEICELKEKEA